MDSGRHWPSIEKFIELDGLLNVFDMFNFVIYLNRLWTAAQGHGITPICNLFNLFNFSGLTWRN